MTEVIVLKPPNRCFSLNYTTPLPTTSSVPRDHSGLSHLALERPAAQFRLRALPLTMHWLSVRRWMACGWIEGTAGLQFNFGAGSLSGSMTVDYYSNGGMGEGYSLGQYGFVNTVYSTGSTTFSGQLSDPFGTGLGSFNGMFTGPGAQELMSSWSAPYTLDGQTSTMFGVWVGKKH